MSFKVKLAIFATLLVVIVASSLSYTILREQIITIVKTEQENRNDYVRGLRQVAREAILVEDDTDMVNYVNDFKRNPEIAHAMVLYPNGKVRIHTDPTQIGKLLDDEATQWALDNTATQTPREQASIINGRDILDLSLPITIGLNQPEFHGIARIWFDKKIIDKQLEESLKETRSQILWAFLISLIVGIIGAIILAFVMTRPIVALKKGARTIGEGKLNHRIRVSTKDELRDLANEFNIMAQKLGELDQMKQDFVSNVTHELRSPMTSIRGYIDLLLKGDGESLTELQRDYLSIIKNSAVRLARFIDNLLDVAKIEAQKLKLTPETLDIYQLAHEMEVLFRPQLEEKKLKFVNGVSKNTSPVFADKDKLAEVLINLISNAVKFTPEKGTISLGCKEESNHLELTVQDSGVGIPQHMIGKLFSKFEQVKSSKGMARQQKGTGLGLTITKGIIETHGGKIWIESPGPDGQGTAFHFTIPKLTEELKQKFNIQ